MNTRNQGSLKAILEAAHHTHSVRFSSHLSCLLVYSADISVKQHSYVVVDVRQALPSLKKSKKHSDGLRSWPIILRIYKEVSLIVLLSSF